MTPTTAVQELGVILRNAGAEPQTEEEIYSSLADAGVPDRVADRVYKFGRVSGNQLPALGSVLQISFFAARACTDWQSIAAAKK